MNKQTEKNDKKFNGFLYFSPFVVVAFFHIAYASAHFSSLQVKLSHGNVKLARN
jgi:hypothetical protein